MDFPCTYSYPSDQTVNEAFWYYIRPAVQPTDLSVDEQFAGRVEFLGDKEGNCTLRMRNLTKSNSGQYLFRFITNPEGFSGKPGVILSVTGTCSLSTLPTVHSSVHPPVNVTFRIYKMLLFLILFIFRSSGESESHHSIRRTDSNTDLYLHLHSAQQPHLCLVQERTACN